jgi:mono/diheme cytochrome c family protein
MTATTLLIFLTLTGCNGQVDPGNQITVLDIPFTASHIEQGQELYMQYCSACHGAEGQGQFPDAPLEPDITGRYGAPPHNPTGHTWHHSDDLLMRYLDEGGFSDLTKFYLMPPFGDVLTHTERMFVIAYIKSLWTPEQRIRQAALTREERRQLSH